MAIRDCIKTARQRKGFSQEELGRIIGVAKQTIQKYENGIISNIPSDKIEAIAKALDTTPAYLMGWEEEQKNNDVDIFKFDNIMPIEKKRFPLLGNIACGEPIFADEEHDLYIEAGADIRADFCLRAKGQSMICIRIFDGDIVFIRKQDIVDNGEVAAVLIEDEVTLKRVYYDREANELSLVAENPTFKTMRFHGEELNQIKILGKAVAFQSNIR